MFAKVTVSATLKYLCFAQIPQDDESLGESQQYVFEDASLNSSYFSALTKICSTAIPPTFVWCARDSGLYDARGQQTEAKFEESWRSSISSPSKANVGLHIAGLDTHAYIFAIRSILSLFTSLSPNRLGYQRHTSLHFTYSVLCHTFPFWTVHLSTLWSTMKAKKPFQRLPQKLPPAMTHSVYL